MWWALSLPASASHQPHPKNGGAERVIRKAASPPLERKHSTREPQDGGPDQSDMIVAADFADNELAVERVRLWLLCYF